MWGQLAAAGIGALGSVAGAAIGAPDATSTKQMKPWDGLRPYLNGKNGPIGRWDMPEMNYNSLAANQSMANGGFSYDAPPPMFMDDPRMTGYGVSVPRDIYGNPIYQPFAHTQMPSESGGLYGYGWGGPNEIRPILEDQYGTLPEAPDHRQQRMFNESGLGWDEFKERYKTDEQYQMATDKMDPNNLTDRLAQLKAKYEQKIAGIDPNQKNAQKRLDKATRKWQKKVANTNKNWEKKQRNYENTWGDYQRPEDFVSRDQTRKWLLYGDNGPNYGVYR